MVAPQIGTRAWSYASVLRDAGLSCFEYIEQLTLLLLKMADQLTEQRATLFLALGAGRTKALARTPARIASEETT